MKDEIEAKEQLIRVLPDDVANQIAAGEVVQRPASIVKELLENAVDAGADSIELTLSEGGLSMIKVRDNGTGMSEWDARLAFERHATSKIHSAADLFDLHTKGFRGEALASIAAVAKVELETSREGFNGVKLVMENSRLLEQSAAPDVRGSCFTIKNLFFTIPARRKFLKSEKVELSHIIEEFFRVALIHPELGFSLVNNQQLLFKLSGGTFKQRIVQLFGTGYAEKLVPLHEETSVVELNGFIVKPEFSRKTRGEQYLFVNGRFIKSPAFHHAIRDSFSDMVPADVHPGYFIIMRVDPSRLDVNIHPTKTEVKFEDERTIYSILKSAVRRSLGKYHVAPAIDFDQEVAFAGHELPRPGEIKMPEVKVNPNYNPFHTEGPRTQNQDWKRFFEAQPSPTDAPRLLPEEEVAAEPFRCFQLLNTYLVLRWKGQLLLVDQHRAHERILYETFTARASQGKAPTQMALFPETINVRPADMPLMEEMLPYLRNLGFDAEVFGPGSILVRGFPPEAVGHALPNLIDRFLEEFKHNSAQMGEERVHQLYRKMAGNMAIRSGVLLNGLEAETLIRNLLDCNMPWVSLHGKPIAVKFNEQDLVDLFSR